MRYRWKTGMLAWVMFRITGLALVGYLSMHIMVISNLHDPNKFNATMKFLGSWQFRILELGLFFVVLYHALNGLRVIIVDFFNGSVHQAKMFWGLAALGLILFIAGAYPMVSHALYWKDVQQGKKTHVSEGYGTVRENEDGSSTRSRQTGRPIRSARQRRQIDRNLRVQDNAGPSSDIMPVEVPPTTSPNPVIAPDPMDAIRNQQTSPNTKSTQRGGK